VAFREKGSKILIKTDEQIEGIRKSCKLAAQCLKEVEPYVKAGVTTEYLNNICKEFIKDHGAVAATVGYNGYKHETCISVNDVICHGIPGKLELRDADMLNIDVTTILNGYYGDTSKMFTVGQTTEHAQKLIAAAKECLNIGIKQCRPGNRVGNIGYEINRYATSLGYSVVYEFCGHGVGVRFHEEPEVCHVADKDSGTMMQAGMTFTIEPMINAGKARAKIDKRDGWTARTIDGKLSAQFEHTILITPGGCEVLTDIDTEYPIK
jgi:methionyl aminopeptidase